MKKVLSVLMIAIVMFSVTACKTINLDEYTEENAVNNEIEVSDGNTIDNSENVNYSKKKITYEEIKRNATVLYPVENDDWKYTVYSDATGVYDKFIEINHYEHLYGNIQVPNEFEGYPVIALGKRAFYTSEIESVEIPDSVIYIGKECFAECRQLSSVVLSNNLITISERAFYYVPLDAIDLPSSLKEIKDYGLYYPDTTHNKDKVILSENIEYLGDHAVDAKDVYVMNPNVKFDGDSLAYPYATIHGYAGSTAAAYCAEYNQSFEVIGE